MIKKTFIPGTALTSSMYNRLDAAKGSRLIDIDQKLTFDDTCSKISQELDDNSLLIGYSLGARLALSAALKDQSKVKGLVLISFNAGIREDEKADRSSKDLEMANLALSDLKQMYSEFDKNPVFSILNSDDQVFLNNARIEDGNIVASQFENLGLGNSPYLADRLIELRMPVLYITGSRDPKYIALNKGYKKLTPFSFHLNVDSDHRVPIVAPNNLSLLIDWFTNNVINR